MVVLTTWPIYHLRKSLRTMERRLGGPKAGLDISERRGSFVPSAIRIPDGPSYNHLDACACVCARRGQVTFPRQAFVARHVMSQV